jgi:hypothetical protein
VIPVAEFPAQGVADQRSLVSDVLHKLSQPLTALQCSLELALVRDQTSEEFRASVEAALQNAERLRHNLLLLRELSDADDPGDTTAPVELQRLLLEWREDFLPVFESAGGCFHLNCAPAQVRGNEAKLRRAFFYLLEYLLGSSHYRSLNVDVEHTKGRRVDIRMTFSSAASSADSTHDASESILTGGGDIACRTFRAVGGDLAPAESAWGQTVWIASLPLGE